MSMITHVVKHHVEHPTRPRRRPEFLREEEKREEEEEVVESIEIREDRTLTKQLRQVRLLLGATPSPEALRAGSVLGGG
jgi:hypothetical protein